MNGLAYRVYLLGYGLSTRNPTHKVGNAVLHITSAQLSAFADAADRLLANDFILYVRTEYERREVQLAGEAYLIGEISDDIIRKMTLAGIARARSWDLTWESNLFGFLALMFCFAPNFDQHPKVSQILGNPDIPLPPNERLDYLKKYMTPNDWSEIVDNYDETAWNIQSAKPKGKH